jgi:HD-GYP domain-containing protein (c-di-GMP phosphodiesterase class II)
MQSSLKKVDIARLRKGMFIHKICGKWLDHPFWRGSFPIGDEKTLEKLRSFGCKEVWIDTGKGLDVESAPLRPTPRMASENAGVVARRKAPVGLPTETRTDFASEVARAELIRDRAKAAVISLFSEARMGKALSMDGAAGVVDEIGKSITRNVAAILSVLRLKEKDDYTYLHSVAVCALMMALGRQLGIEGEALQDLGLAGLFHDIGKIGVPDAVLNKPGRLDEEEFAAVRKHPEMGWDILQNQLEVSPTVLDVCLHHHERCDATGYPHKLSGDALTRAARMGAICDVYDAVTSERCYKKGWEPADAIRRMAEWQDGHFDREIFHAFVKMIGIYPAGTLVRLTSGRLAIVLDQNEKSSLKPTVKVFYSTRFDTHVPSGLLDLADASDAIVGVEDHAKWNFNIPMLMRN